MSTVGENKGKYHVKLRITYQAVKKGKKMWVQKNFRTGLFCTIGEFKSVMGNPRTSELQDLKRKVVKLEAKAVEIVENNGILTPEIFEMEFTGKGGYDNVIDLFDTIIKKKHADGDVGTADSYQNARNKFAEFGGESISFAEVNLDWLQRFEKWAVKGKTVNEKVVVAPISYTTVGIYMRYLRAVFNHAIRIRKIPADLYPFREYKIPSGQGTPRPLTDKQKEVLLNFESADTELRRARDFWQLSYLSYGLNFSDICRLRRKDIKEGMFVVLRYKTRNTNRVRKPLVIPVHPEADRIINTWGSRSLNPESYIFPVLEGGLNPRQEKNRIKDFLKLINTGLKTIGKELKITNLTTYTARHTFATTVRDKGIGKEFIQEALGHNSMQTTENYLGSLNTEIHKKISGLL